MKKGIFRIHLSIISIFLLTVLSFAQSNEKTKKIMGTIVDESGLPVKHALVRLYDSVTHILQVDYTTTEGLFYFETETKSNKPVIFVDDIEPNGFFSPLFYLLEEKRQKIYALQGRSISVDKPRNNLGKLTMPYRYGKVIVDLQSIFGSNSTQNFVGNINLIIKDKNERIVDTGFLSKAAFDETLTKLKLVLPVRGNETVWGLRIEYTSPAKIKKVFERNFTLKKLDCQKLSLIDEKQQESNCE